jgi:hypothetical protein
VDRDNPWATLINAAGAAGAVVVLLYAIGGLVLSMRFAGFGLNGQEAAALVPREVLLFAGARSLALWALAGVVLVLMLRGCLWLFGRMQSAGRAGPLSGRSVVVVLAGVLLTAGLVLVLVSRVVWPLAALAAAAAILGVEACWRDRPVRRLLITLASLALVAVAYEADRLKYTLNWTRVDVAQERDDIRGILIAHTDRGLYVGAPPSTDPSGRALPYRLVFVPQSRVDEAFASRRTKEVIEQTAEDRRRAPLARVSDIEVR